jgi:hypothetical protein
MIDSLELIASRLQLAEGGLYGYAVLTTGRPVLLWGPLARPLGAIFRYPAVLVLPGAQLLFGGMLLVAAIAHDPGLVVAAGVSAAAILALRMLLYLRNQLGLDGSDQMILVASSGVAAALLVPDHTAQRIALDYIALQLLLSYAVAGWAKAISPVWRSGRAIPGIMSTIGYGAPPVGKLLVGHPRVGRALCWVVILFECSAPVLILAGTPGALLIIAAGIGFHVSIAFLMGLNIFPWSFGAAYPALILLAQQIDTLWR